MKTYELTYIISSAVMSEESEKTKQETEAFIQSLQGVIVKSEKTNAQTLAYPIKKQSSGYFVITEFQVDEDKVKTIKEKLEKDKNILRSFIIVKRPAKIMKARRTRKPVDAVELPGKDKAKHGQMSIDKDKNHGEKVEMEEINKTLDEILS